MGRRNWVRTLSGLVVLAAGLIILINTLGGTRASVGIAQNWWPVALVALALANIATFIGKPFRKKTGLFWPLLGMAVFLAAAAVTLLATTHILPTHASRYVLPLVLVVVGALLATVNGHPDRVHQAWITESAVLRRVRLASVARGIYNIKVLAVMGEVAIDLTGATLAGNTELQASAWGGRVRVLVPAGWVIEKTSVAGPSVEIEVPPVPMDLKHGYRASLSVSLLGSQGRLQIDWGEPEFSLRTDQASSIAQAPDGST